MLEKSLIEVIKKYPDKTAIAYDTLRISYQEFYANITHLSNYLSTFSIDRGDCIALNLPNSPEFAIAFYATAKLNAIVLPINPLLKEEELSHYIIDSNTRAIITNSNGADISHKIISKIDKRIELIVLDDTYPFTKEVDKSIITESTSIFKGDVLYQYSSGSTGRPKRVCRTQNNLYQEVINFTETTNISPEDNILCIVPLYHAHGLGNCLLATIHNGATLVILEQVSHQGKAIEVPFVFRRSRVLELIEKEKITILPAVPYIFNTLAETPDDTQVDVSTLKLCFSAGNFLSKEIFDKFIQRFGIPPRQLYGCTEAGSIAINLDEDLKNTYNSVGCPLKNIDIKIIDDAGKELPIGSIGEIVIKSQALTRGYHNQLEVNQQVFKDGSFFTGDLGKKDEFGRVYITGRTQIFIDTGGHKVDPLEIENILLTHSQVKEAVVVGIKGLYAGEIIKAVIVPQNQGICEEKDILSYCKDKLADFKVPKIIEFRDEIPKSPLGKILRKSLIDNLSETIKS
ncbi:class I adenylate-forming enzyme family protein [Nostoc sp. 'Peltigera membranacea cyanobiont' 232]|uniref:class I adenylate-forming enzyme family protein n=1 Tax=Nostoc sp. 'Peltigera membranacea cyanobiont' 232 TaxID=2014531 RepID=UPI000B951B9F|nr:AMP-binding protein [Nostoc sp. 'Peltigera membranacea cyanobiont' 232]OYE06093.1 acyl-CoA synthetase [Nostoc sp. 'Peltigera membranacea cyanobiont' 232]